MKPVTISAVSYLNTFPFVFGLKTSGKLDHIDLQLDVPSVCAKKLKNREVDLALVPSGALPDFDHPVLVSDYCIGAEGDVKTVLLLSRKPLHEIREIALDFDSRTSVELVKILAEKHWHIKPRWFPLGPDEAVHSAGIESMVAIGDKTFTLVNEYPYVYDLAGEWVRFSSLPFVFAVWVTNTILPESFPEQFNQALRYGIERKQEIPAFFPDRMPPGLDVMNYLENNISYHFDARKKEGLNAFLTLLGS